MGPLRLWERQLDWGTKLGDGFSSWPRLVQFSETCWELGNLMQTQSERAGWLFVRVSLTAVMVRPYNSNSNSKFACPWTHHEDPLCTSSLMVPSNNKTKQNKRPAQSFNCTLNIIHFFLAETFFYYVLFLFFLMLSYVFSGRGEKLAFHCHSICCSAAIGVFFLI